MSDQSQFDGKKFGADLRDQIHREIDQNLAARNLRPRRHSGMIPGIILVVVGTLFLLDHLGLILAAGAGGGCIGQSF
jgi:hypothetical protein